MIAVGIMVVIISCLGMANSEQLNGPGMMSQLANTMPYEQMWALHILPMGLFAIGTDCLLPKTTAQMAMLSSASVLVIVGGGMDT